MRVLGSGPHTPTQFFWEYPPPPNSQSPNTNQQCMEIKFRLGRLHFNLHCFSLAKSTNKNILRTNILVPQNHSHQLCDDSFPVSTAIYGNELLLEKMERSKTIYIYYIKFKCWYTVLCSLKAFSTNYYFYKNTLD